MHTWKERTVVALDQAHEMSIATIDDIYDTKDHNYLCGDDIHDLCHAVKTLYLCVMTRELVETHAI